MSETQNNLKRSISPLPQPDEQEQQGRQRSRAACVPCRQRKRKCDNHLPCATCVRYEYQCVYNTSKRSSHMPPADVALELPQPASLPYVRPGSARIQQQPHPLTAPGARFHHRAILDPNKIRFVKANSAIAFPRILAMDLESDTVPRLHSFAWHLGIRSEPPDPHIELTSLLTWEDVQNLANVYFSVVRPEIGHLEEASFMESAAARFADPHGVDDIDAVILSVAALGSFFSPSPHPREENFVTDAANALRGKSMLRSPSLNSIAAWILRTFYLRLTARPHAAWMSSCITLHELEALGLHKEMQTIAVVYPAAPSGDHKLAKTRRRLFWVAKAVNVILSFEYGRSIVNFDIVTTKKFAPENGTYAHEFVELANMLPSDVAADHDPDPPIALGSTLTKIENMQSESSFINLLRADLAFAIYRRLWLMSLTDAKDRAESVIAIGRGALEASSKLVKSRTPWWNVLGAPFQFLCVVLAIGTPKSLAIVPDIMNQLHQITQTYDTHMVREAYNQGLALVNMARKRKEKEMNALNAVAGMVPFEDPPSNAASSTISAPPNIDWAATEMPFEWDWEAFLNPSLIMSSQESPLAADGPAGGQGGFSGF